MNELQAAQTVQRVFEKIHREDMAGLPLLNPALKVQTLGFRDYRGRTIGVVITPWMMSLVMLPGADDDWDALALGKKVAHEFPSACYKFWVNNIDGIGPCRTYSLYSPMRQFLTQDQAVAAARQFLDGLMTEAREADTDPVDEELLGRILRGEEVPAIETAANDVDATQAHGTGVAAQPGAPAPAEKTLSRRTLLRGGFAPDP